MKSRLPKSDKEFIARMEAALGDHRTPEAFAAFGGCDVDEAISLMSYMIPWTMIRHGLITPDGELMGTSDANDSE